MSPTHVTFGADAVKSRFTRSANETARLSGRVRFFRRFFGLATKPWRAIDFATDFSLTTHPTARKSTTNRGEPCRPCAAANATVGDRKSTRLNSSHTVISYAVFCLKKKKKKKKNENENRQ